MKRKKFVKVILLFTCCLILFPSCFKIHEEISPDSKKDDYYNQDGNFSGSIYDRLDKLENYSHFLQGIDSTGYTLQLQNTLITVIAPNNASFEKYFKKFGFDSISDIPLDTLRDIIGHHIITWPQSPTSFVNDPLTFKKRSNMAQTTMNLVDPFFKKTYKILKEAKYLQFYFPEMLNLYGGTENDYKLLSGVELSAIPPHFNIYDSKIDSIKPTGNGWIYYSDKVIEPVQNLDDWLIGATDYSTFMKLYNRFNIYYPDEKISNTIKIKRSNVHLTSRGYRLEMELRFETVHNTDQSEETAISQNASSGFTVIAPKNVALDNFIDTYFTKISGFKSSLNSLIADDINSLHVSNIIRAIIRPFLIVDQLIFPSDLTSAEGIFAFDGTNIKLTESEISDFALCSNGYAYGLDSFTIPRTFKSILKPAFTTNDYQYFTAALFKANIIGYLNDIDADYTLLLPTDAAFNKQNIRLVDLDTYNTRVPSDIIDDEEGLQQSIFIYDADPLIEPSIRNKQDLFSIIFNQLFTSELSPTSQVQHIKNAVGNYIGYKDDSIWGGGNKEERWVMDALGNISEVTPVIPILGSTITSPEVDNGKIYITQDLIKAPNAKIINWLLFNPQFSKFKEICENAGIIVDGDLQVFADYPTLFIPTNDVMKAYIPYLPSEEDELQNFIKYFFIDFDVFSSQTVNKSTETLSINVDETTDFTTVYRSIDISGTPGNLKVKGENNTSYINIIEGKESNIICKDGIIHLIDGVLN